MCNVRKLIIFLYISVSPQSEQNLMETSMKTFSIKQVHGKIYRYQHYQFLYWKLLSFSVIYDDCHHVTSKNRKKMQCQRKITFHCHTINLVVSTSRKHPIKETVYAVPTFHHIICHRQSFSMCINNRIFLLFNETERCDSRGGLSWQ